MKSPRAIKIWSLMTDKPLLEKHVVIYRQYFPRNIQFVTSSIKRIMIRFLAHDPLFFKVGTLLLF